MLTLDVLDFVNDALRIRHCGRFSHRNWLRSCNPVAPNTVIVCTRGRESPPHPPWIVSGIRTSPIPRKEHAVSLLRHSLLSRLGGKASAPLRSGPASPKHKAIFDFLEDRRLLS